MVSAYSRRPYQCTPPLASPTVVVPTMAIDLHPSEPGPDRPLDKKKKRRSRKKRAAPKDLALSVVEPEPKLPPELLPLLFPLQPEPTALAPPPQAPLLLLLHASPLSPRKQALLRHKKSDASVGEPLFVSEVKQLKKTRKPSARLPAPGAEDERFSQLLAGQSMADKATIFRAPSARISVYHEQVGDPATTASGTLLGHGEFTIFQLHNGAITYLACGSSFVYPLLPKLKILRVNRTHFILPLVNPQRYWKIDVDAGDGDTKALSQLERVLQGIVNYTTLYVELENSRAGHVDTRPPVLGADDATVGHYIPFFNTIPESPPSAPVSPHQLNLYDPKLACLPSPAPRMMSPPQLDLNGTKLFLLVHKDADTIPQTIPQSMSQTVPMIPTESQPPPHPGPHPSLPTAPALPTAYPTPALPPLPKLAVNPSHSNPYKYASDGSDSSSMDSLLDEYEENVSMTKSINFNASRPPSHSASLVSTSHPPVVHYARGRAFVLPERSVAGSSYGGRRNDEPLDDGFPTTSLSQYNRRRTSQGGRSRQSSVSELYTSVSNWMEPGTGGPQLTHSRSNYSLGGRQGGTRPVSAKDTYRDIYRSITLHDIAALATGQENKWDTRHYSKLLVTDQFSRRPASAPRPAPKPEPSQSRLSSSEVFQLLSQREEKVERPSGIGRFFGW